MDAMLSQVISTPEDNILVEIREIGPDGYLRAGQHVAASDPKLFAGEEENLRTTFAATRLAWSPISVEIVINGAPSGVLAADRDSDDPGKFIVWFNDLPTWAGERLYPAALSFARTVAAAKSGGLITA